MLVNSCEPSLAKVTTKNNNTVYAPRVGGMGLFSHKGVVAAKRKRSPTPTPSPNIAYGYRATGGMGLFSKKGPVPVFSKNMMR